MDLNILDKASGFLRTGSLASLTWTSLKFSEDEEQWGPSSCVPVSFKDELEASPGLRCTVTIVFGSFTGQQTCLWEADSRVNDDGGHVVGPARRIDRGLGHHPQ